MDIYGLMTVSGVPKPGWRAFQLLHEHAGSRRVPATVQESKPSSPGSRPVSDANATAIGAAVRGVGCTVEEHTNLEGFDIRTAAADDEAACCAACKAESRCSFWT
jgi:hypothetical protein